jgi:cellulose synthase/poly-beta-1,6-N-acetylglucosamine synthase-like glycosyltransferase
MLSRCRIPRRWGLTTCFCGHVCGRVRVNFLRRMLGQQTSTQLAEDRVLSFGMVLRTQGLKTVWVRGATFFYEPMWDWRMLLGQRRRWMNGEGPPEVWWEGG